MRGLFRMATSKQFPNPFAQLANQYRQLRQQLPRQVSIIAAAHFKENFRRQGILNNGTVISWKQRRAQDDRTRAILIQSGRLRRAIRPSATFDYAIVSNDTPYAQIHNEGGTISGSVTVGEHTRRTYHRDETSAPGARKPKFTKEETGSHTVSSHNRQVNTTMPARPFMVETPDLMDEFEQHLFNEIDKLWK